MKCHDLPTAGAFSLANCTVPVALSDLAGDQGGEFAHVNMHIADGRIASIEKARPNLRPSDAIDVRGAMVFPCFVDLHSHLDKNHIWPRAGLTDGSFGAAIEAVAGDRARWTDREVRARMAFGIRCAYAHGTQAIRTHIDSNHAGSARDWEIFSALRDEWRGRVALQAVSIVSVAELVESGISESIADMVAVHGGVLGASTRPIPQLEQVIETLFDLAEARGLDLDFHVDETDDIEAAALQLIARTAIRRGFQGSIVVGHCCNIALQDERRAAETLDLIAEAGLTVVSLPVLNLQLQDRKTGRTPRWRGVTLVHEMRARGIKLAIGGDNVRDPFHAYGDHDMLQIYRDATRIAHLDQPVGDWPTTVTTSPATVMGLGDIRIQAGAPADFILFAARNYSELLARPQHDRCIVRNGIAANATLPDFAELDEFSI